ncbi:MAG TPA: ADOP family duplicated permease, partial [Bryobacteraceae bacterium]
LTWLGQRLRFRSEMADEIEFHLESRADELESQGIPRSEALACARREFGSKLNVAEESSEAWQLQWLEDFISDLRYAARAFRRNPGFAATAVFCLALGIGANTTIFNVTTSFLFSEPSCRDTQSLISIWEGGNSSSPLADYEFLRDSRVFDGMAGLNVESETNWREGDHTSRLYSGIVTDDFFTTLGVPLLLGRGIAPHETNTAVLSWRMWHSKLAADPAILGRKLVLDGRLYTVAGVLPKDHRSIMGFGIAPEIYIPAQPGAYVQLYARMPQAMTIAIARARLQTLLNELDRIHPNSDQKRNRGTRVTSVIGFDILNQQMPGAIIAFFVMLLVVVGLVLLIACTNVVSLLLARAASRSQELAIRLSLGASRRRIIRHLLAESLLLSLGGALAGFAINLFCAWLIDRITFPIPVPVHLVVSPDWRLVWYSLALVFLCALVCGVVPALKAVKRGINDSLKRQEHQTERAFSLRAVLVACQIAASVVLLTAGFLFLHNLLRATAMNPGFDVRSTLWSMMRLVPAKYEGPAKEKQLLLAHSALDKLRALPGVETAAITRRVPLNDNCVMGVPVQTDRSAAQVHVRYQCNDVGPDYFRAIGIPLLAGREFTSEDRKGAQPVVIVNETFAQTLFGKTNPLGHTFRLGLSKQEPRLIVGVVKDSKYFALGERQQLAVYEPYFASDEPATVNFIVRTRTSPDEYVRTISSTLGHLDTTAAIETKPMSRALGLALLPSQAGAVMLGAMGVLGLLLAAIGLYGVLLYSVSRRTREIGVRAALGATRRDILGMVGRQSAILVGGGMTAGLVLAFFATRPLAFFLVPGLKPLDWSAFFAVSGVLAVVALLATLVPATRALRVDPSVALRYE